MDVCYLKVISGSTLDTRKGCGGQVRVITGSGRGTAAASPRTTASGRAGVELSAADHQLEWSQPGRSAPLTWRTARICTAASRLTGWASPGTHGASAHIRGP